MTQKSIKIVVPVYNCEKWISKTITSIKSQTHEDFECCIINDMSTDNTADVIQDSIDLDRRFKFIDNTEKKYALKNIYDGIKFISSNDEDILTTVDGDDWLAHDHVLETVYNVYESTSCLITYGNFCEYPSQKKHLAFSTPYDQDIIDNNTFRNTEWKASHLRTFKKKLWDRIDVDDLINPKTNEFYEVAWDLAFMYPMLEMAGNRSENISEVLYIYNKENPLSDMYIKTQEQISIADDIRNKNKYSKVDFDDK
jgi:glycosyltransferase involved in cell wall biosynthesis